MPRSPVLRNGGSRSVPSSASENGVSKCRVLQSRSGRIGVFAPEGARVRSFGLRASRHTGAVGRLPGGDSLGVVTPRRGPKWSPLVAMGDWDLPRGRYDGFPIDGSRPLSLFLGVPGFSGPASGFRGVRFGGGRPDASYCRIRSSLARSRARRPVRVTTPLMSTRLGVPCTRAHTSNRTQTELLLKRSRVC